MNAFAAVATALLQSGAQSVVAMAYSLYVSGAQVFLPSSFDEWSRQKTPRAPSRNASITRLRSQLGIITIAFVFPFKTLSSRKST